MATIKLQNDKVILKNGKVSCTCCGEECCLYPAQFVYTGGIKFEDLPEQLEYKRPTIQFTLNKVTPYAKEGGLVYYEGPDEESYITLVGPDLSQLDNFICGFSAIPSTDIVAAWRGSPGVGSFADKCCLVDFPKDLSTGVFDEFADTYTATYTYKGVTRTTTFARVSLCIWEGFDNCGIKTILNLTYFGFPDFRFGYKWVFYVNDPDCNIPEMRFAIKDGPANTPVGSYSNEPPNPISGTVS